MAHVVWFMWHPRVCCSWGDASYGGTTPLTAWSGFPFYQIVGNTKAFAAIRIDGSVFAWGQLRCASHSSRATRHSFLATGHCPVDTCS